MASTTTEAPVQERNETEGEQPGPRTATAEPQQQQKPRHLPQWKVLLHNDDVNDMVDVVRLIVRITTLTVEEATERMVEAHKTGVALLLVTHQERAELYQEQFTSARLIATIEPD